MEKLKNIVLNKRLVAIILLIITMMTNVSQVFAASGSGTYVAGQYGSKVFTTDSYQTTNGMLIRRLVNTTTGKQYTVFCSEHGADIKTGSVYNGEYYTPVDETIKKACKVAYFGWYSKYGDYVIDGGILDESMKYVKYDYVFTQQYIWTVLGQSDATFIDSDIQTMYEQFIKEIETKIANAKLRPSFDATTIEIDAGETKILTDTNGVLADYSSIDVTKDNIRFVHNKGENTITITASENVESESIAISDNTFLNWGMVKEGTKNKDTTIYFTFPNGVQDQLIAMDYNDPVPMSLKLKVNLFGNLELQKLDTTNTLVDGAVYNVSSVNGYNEDITVTNGKIVVEKLNKGTYTVKEIKAPTGYLVDNNTYTVEVKSKEISTQAIIDSEPTGSIKITKSDIITGNADRIDGEVHHGDASLKGAVYTLYASEDIYNKSKTTKYFSKDEEIATYIFNEYGVATIEIKNNSVNLVVDGEYLTGLPIGKYIAKETTVPTGYKQDETTYSFNLEYKDQNTAVIKTDTTVNEDVDRAKFEIIKISSNNNSTANKIANAEFTAILSKYVEYYGSFDEALNHLNEYADDEYDVIITNKNGHGTSKLLAYGLYEVRETKTPSDEIETVEPFYVTIDQDSNEVIKEYIENDLPFESYLKFVKVDKNTGKKVTFSNTTFSLSKLNEDTNEWEKVKCKTGIFSHDKWETDKDATAYTETKLAAGTYKVDEIITPTGFLELEEPVVFKINRSNKTLEFDEDYDAYITVTIGNEQPTATLKVDKTIALNENVDTSLVDTSDLSKIAFKLQAKENIIDYADGSIIYEKGRTIKEFNLDKKGNYTIENLPMGDYELVETKTIEGIVLDTTPIEVKFTQEDNTTKVYTKTLNIVNTATEFEFSKTDITGDEELEGAKLTVLDDEGNVIDTWISTNESHKIEGLEVEKTYTLREKIVPEGFAKATDIQFTVENTKDIQHVTMIDKIVEVSKTDFVTGEEIEGAELEVIDKETGKTVDKWTSTKESHKVTGLEEGKEYILKETTAPYGYELTEQIEFTVTTDKETQKVEMKDMPILKSIRVEKIDIDTKEHIKSNKFVFGIYEDEECKNLIKESGANEDEGTALFDELRYGTYYIKEIKAPLGYKLSDQVVKIEINDEGVFADGAKLEEQDNVYSFEYYNSLLPVIQTGNETNYAILGIVAILSLIGIIGIAYKLKKKNN